MTKWKAVKIEDHEHAAWCEVRPHSDGTLDELVVRGGATVHIEQISARASHSILVRGFASGKKLLK